MKDIIYWLYDNQDRVTGVITRYVSLLLFVACIVGGFFNAGLFLFAPFLFLLSQIK